MKDNKNQLDELDDIELSSRYNNISKDDWFSNAKKENSDVL